jgi:hypothetical protein
MGINGDATREVLMSKSVLGILDNEGEARKVRLELNAAGFSDADIGVVSKADSIHAGTNSAPLTTTVVCDRQSQLGPTIADFFRSLPGQTGHNENAASDLSSYANDQSYYAEALERGRIVVIVRAQDQESADNACKVLNRHGGDNISADTKPDEVRGVTTLPASNGAIQAVETLEPHLTPSERTEGRVQDRGVRVYDYAHAAEAPANLAQPQPPDAMPGPRTSTART